MAKKWYVLHTYSGKEEKVKENIDTLKEERLEYAELIGEVLVPTQEVVQFRKGKKVKQTRKFFSSYVIIELEMDRDVRHELSNLPNVTDFIGTPDGKPIPLRQVEIDRILGQTKKVDQKEISEIPYSVGDSVKIKDGPFKDFTGVVEEVSPEKGKIKVMVSVFGRSTPVEVDFVQVSPVS